MPRGQKSDAAPATSLTDMTHVVATHGQFMWQYMQWVYGTNQNFEVVVTYRFRNQPTGSALFAGYNQGTSMIQYLCVTCAAMAHGCVQVQGHMGNEFRDMRIRLPRGAGLLEAVDPWAP